MTCLKFFLNTIRPVPKFKPQICKKSLKFKPNPWLCPFVNTVPKKWLYKPSLWNLFLVYKFQPRQYSTSQSGQKHQYEIPCQSPDSCLPVKWRFLILRSYNLCVFSGRVVEDSAESGGVQWTTGPDCGHNRWVTCRAASIVAVMQTRHKITLCQHCGFFSVFLHSQ